MTLIVGFKCDLSVVLCADSQETRGGFKSEVNKVPVHRDPGSGMEVVCGGAGHGELTDAFRPRAIAAITQSPISGEETIRRKIEAALTDFHRSRVFTTFVASIPEDKLIAGLIAVRDTAHAVHLFKYMGPVVQPVSGYELAGEEYAYMKRFAGRRYRPGLSIRQAIILGIEVVSEAKATSPYVGGPTRVVTVEPGRGAQEEDADRIVWTEAHVNKQNELFDLLRFDLSSTGAQTEETLRTFSNSITSVKNLYGSPFPAWPKGPLGKIFDDGSE